jgi:UDP-N-acetyl-2-amino-2-deoxyglucuronate dehydrogenase
MKRKILITGVAGYIAPRHLQSIKDTGNRLIAAMDPHDSVGILDRYFPDASFFTEFERFDRHTEKLRRTSSDEKIDYLTICSPNHLHDAHIRLALRLGANVICEKPLVLNQWNLDALSQLEQEPRKSIS